MLTKAEKGYYVSRPPSITTQPIRDLLSIFCISPTFRGGAGIVKLYKLHFPCFNFDIVEYVSLTVFKFI